MCACDVSQIEKESKLKGRVCLGKGGLESVRKEFPKFSKSAAHIVLLNLFSDHKNTHTHTYTHLDTVIQMCVLVYEQRSS